MEPAIPVASSWWAATNGGSLAVPAAGSGVPAAATEGGSSAAAAEPASSPSAVDLPTVSSLTDCVQFYMHKLTTKQRCGLRPRAGSNWRVGTACSGTDSVVKVLGHLGRSSGWTFARIQLRTG